MTTHLQCKIVEGLMPSEKIAIIQGADGNLEEVAVSMQNITGDRLMAFIIGVHEGKVLVELPRETVSGRWRMWVNQSAIGG
jgi:hypothetical protein